MVLCTRGDRATTERSLTLTKQSSMEFINDGEIRKDPDTAHKEAHDPDQKKFIPQECWQCFAQALSEDAAEEAGKE